MNRKRGYPIPGEASTGVVFCVDVFFLADRSDVAHLRRPFVFGAQGLRPGLTFGRGLCS
jgi:hypothetical protein